MSSGGTNCRCGSSRNTLSTLRSSAPSRVTDDRRPLLPSSASREALMFPTLTGAQIERIAAHGVIRSVSRGDILVEAGDPVVPFFVVKSGEIEIIRPSPLGDTLVAV